MGVVFHRLFRLGFCLMLITLVSTLQALQAQRRFSIGRQRHPSAIGCTLVYRHYAAWQDEASLNRFIQSSLAPVGPASIKGGLERTQRKVLLEFEFQDPSILYIGSTPEYSPTGGLASIGPEGVGIDGMLVALVDEFLPLCTELRTSEVGWADDEEFLGGPLEMGVVLTVRNPLELEVIRSSGLSYEGEFKYLHRHSDSLSIPLHIDGDDTVATVHTGKALSWFECYALKALCIRERLKYAFWKSYGPQPANLFAIPSEKRGIFPIIWTPIDLLTNYPNQDTPLKVGVCLRFCKVIKIQELIGLQTNSGDRAR